MTTDPQNNSILWQSDDKQIIVIDIPQSIASAQGTHENPCQDLLSSTSAQTEPYQTNEPKSAAARSQLIGNTVASENHNVYAELLQDALSQIRAVHKGAWCLPRLFVESSKDVVKKRKLSSRDDDELSNSVEKSKALHLTMHDQYESLNKFLQTLSRRSFSVIHGLEYEAADISYTILPVSDLHARARLSWDVKGNHDASHVFYIPPAASFVLGPCSDSRALHNSVRAQAQELETSKKFDFILLDPPWPNRSVKRTHKTAQSTYSTARSLEDIYQLIMGMDLDVLMQESCMVAIWITNKPAVRDLVLGQGGLFDCWGVELIEEWIWLKTTVTGEPVTPIDSVWRKPYEVLVLGRKRGGYAEHAAESTTTQKAVRRRVFTSVPDLHSRKPCLKELVETALPVPDNYRALEVFARYLVAGWWSWGDECIKFNEQQYWRCKEEGLPVEDV